MDAQQGTIDVDGGSRLWPATATRTGPTDIGHGVVAAPGREGSDRSEGAASGGASATSQRLMLSDVTPQEAYRQLVQEPATVLGRAQVALQPTPERLSDGARFDLVPRSAEQSALPIEIALQPDNDTVAFRSRDGNAEQAFSFGRDAQGRTALTVVNRGADDRPLAGALAQAGDRGIAQHAIGPGDWMEAVGDRLRGFADRIIAQSPIGSPETTPPEELGPETLLYAKLSKDVYGDARADLDPHVQRLDPGEIEQQLGIDPAILNDTTTGYAASLYHDSERETYILANRGTEGVIDPDTIANLKQGLGLSAAHYDRAIYAGVQLAAATGGNIAFTGHSLGGGLAAAQALATGAEAVTFNAAGLHPDTIERSGLDTSAADDLVTAVRVEGDILTELQENPWADAVTIVGSTLPKNIAAGWEYLNDAIGEGEPSAIGFGVSHLADATGEPSDVPAVDRNGEAMNYLQRVVNSVQLHGIDAVIRSLEHADDRR